MEKMNGFPVRHYDTLDSIANNSLRVSNLVSTGAISANASAIYYHVQYVSFVYGCLTEHHPISVSRFGQVIGIVTNVITAKYIKEALDAGLITCIKQKGKSTKYAINNNIGSVDGEL